MATPFFSLSSPSPHVCVSICLSVNAFVSNSISGCLFRYLSIYQSVWLSLHFAVYVPLCVCTYWVSRWHRTYICILDVHFSHCIVVKIVMFV